MLQTCQHMLGPIIYHHMKEPEGKLSLATYRRYIPEVYRLNPHMKSLVGAYREQCGLSDKPFDSIFVRWGDKLIAESKYYEPRLYVEKLCGELSPQGTDIFVHSDDHDEVMRFQHYIQEHHPQRRVHYITDSTSDSGGALVAEWLRPYTKLAKPSVETMTSGQRRAHTEKMLCALEIMRGSGVVVTDFQSNVSRFMKLYYDCPVHSILGEDPDMTVPTANPAYGF